MSKTNKEMVLEMIEVTTNARQFDRYSEFFSAGAVYYNPPYAGCGFFPDSSGDKYLIKYVHPGGPSDGRLFEGDLIIRISDGELTLNGFEEIKNWLGKGIPGSIVTFLVVRNGKPVEVAVTRGVMSGLTIPFKMGYDVNIEDIKKNWPDLQVKVELAVEEGEYVVVYLIYSGKNLEFNRFAIWPSCEIYRIQDGMITEARFGDGENILLAQLGYSIIPPNK